MPHPEQMQPMMSPKDQKINIAFVVLERVAARDDSENEVTALRNAAAKAIREHLETPVDNDFEGIWTPQVAKA